MLFSIVTLFLAGCSNNLKVSADEIMQNAIESEKEITEYYGKAEIKTYEGKELIEHTLIEEHASGKQKKVTVNEQLLEQEIVSLSDGTTSITYDVTNQLAYEMDVSEFGDLAGLNPKEQVKLLLEAMNDSHTYEVVGEEKVLYFDTYHVQLKTNADDSLIGDMELWVDQKTWFIVKLKSKVGDIRSEMSYVELDFSPKFAEDTFTIDIPEGIELTNLNEEFAPDVVTLEEAEEALGQPFLTFSNDDLELTSIQMYDLGGEYQLELEYNHADGTPMATLTIFPAFEEMDTETGEFDLEIRGNYAEYEEMLNAYFWDEDGLSYTLMANPDISFEDVQAWTENMTLHTAE